VVGITTYTERITLMNDARYIGLSVHQATICVVVGDADGKLIMESIIETRAEMILHFIPGLRGSLQVTFEEGTCAAWLPDFASPSRRQGFGRKNAFLKSGNKNEYEMLSPGPKENY
jgi:hypothetical protein